jgi:hypothetical protein
LRPPSSRGATVGPSSRRQARRRVDGEIHQDFLSVSYDETTDVGMSWITVTVQRQRLSVLRNDSLAAVTDMKEPM